MLERCWLHIGAEKTGTTSIQEFLAQNRNSLLAQGHLYPTAPGLTNHVGLVAHALDDERLDSNRRAFGLSNPDAIAAYRRKLVKNLQAEMRDRKISTVIFSNEHLSSRLMAPSEFRRIRDLCGKFARTTKVIIYIRNQVDFLVSRYIESVKGGNTESFPFPIRTGVARLVDYAELLAPWREAFGAENLVVRRYEREDFPGGDLLMDFAAQVGIDATRFVVPKWQNKSLDATCVEFLREFNKWVPHLIDGRRNPLRGRVVQDLEQMAPGEPLVVSRDIARAIELQFRATNERVSADYFGSRHQPLFRPARSVASSDRDQSVAKDIAQSVRLAAHLWMAQQQRWDNPQEKLARQRQQVTTPAGNSGGPCAVPELNGQGETKEEGRPRSPMSSPCVVQYWHARPPHEVQELMDTWRTMADEGFEYVQYDDNTALEFIRQHFDSRTETAYCSCGVPAMKADLLRICALIIRPGIYVDADMRRTGKGQRKLFTRDRWTPLRPLFDRLHRGILFERETRVANSFIVVKRAQDPLLRAVLELALRNIEERVANNVYLVTGPGIATNLLKAVGRDHELFRGFEFWTQEDLLPYMRMVGNLPYKKTPDHWVNAQASRSIFLEE